MKITGYLTGLLAVAATGAVIAAPPEPPPPRTEAEVLNALMDEALAAEASAAQSEADVLTALMSEALAARSAGPGDDGQSEDRAAPLPLAGRFATYASFQADSDDGLTQETVATEAPSNETGASESADDDDDESHEAQADTDTAASEDAAQPPPEEQTDEDEDSNTNAEEPEPEADQEEAPPTQGPAEAEPLPPLIDMGTIQLSGNDVIIESLPGGNILIHGQAEDVAIIQALIQRLDRDVPPRQLEIITLENKKATEVAQGVQTILRDLYETERPERPQERVTVSALSTNIVLIAAPAAKMPEVIRIVKSIDAVPEALPDFELMTFDIQYIKPSTAAAKLQEFVDKIRQKQGAEAGPEFQISAFDDTGKITVLGPKDQESKLRQLLEQIDAKPREGFGEIKLVLFPLLNNEAKDMADTLKELLTVPEGKEAAAEAIRRLRMIKRTPEGEEEELPPVDLEKPLKIIPDDGTQSLIIATVDENIDPIGELIALLDKVPLAVEMGVQIFPLRYADADSVAKLLDDMFEQGKKLPRPAPGDDKTEAVPESPQGEALVYNVAVVADMRTNTLITSGRPAQMALIQSVVAQLDQPSTAVKFPLRLLELQHSDATRIAKVIEELFTKRVESLEKRQAGASAVERERVFVAADIRSNSVIVSASPENYDEIVRMVEKLDGPSDRLFESIRIINCDNTSAADLQSKIEELWKRKADLRREGDVPEDLPVVVADQRSNSLVIASSPEDFDEIKKLVERLEAQPLSPIAEIRLIALVNNDASEIGDMIKTLFEERMKQRLVQGQEENPADRVAVAVDTATNTILVASSRENFDEMMRIVETIDREPDLEGVVRVFFLHNAVAADVAEHLKDLFDQGLYNPSTGLDSKLAEERQKVALVDDPRSNAIIASGSKTNLSILEQLIGQMDSDEPLMLQAETRLFRLEFADAVQNADMLQKLFEGIKSNAAEPDLFPQPTIIADERSNTLIVTGTKDALKRCGDLLRSIDVEAGPTTAYFEIYMMHHASAARLAPKMQEMFDKRNEGRQQEQTPVFIQADEATNTLICTASRDDHTLITGLLRLLDRPSTIAKQVEIFPLRAAKAEAVAERLQNVFKSQAQISGGTDRADVLAVEPDPRTNSLVVWAAPSEMASIADVIHKLDTTEPATEMMVKVIRLERALATDFADVLDKTLNGEGGAGQGKDAQAVIISFEETMPDGSKQLRKLLRQDVTISADARSNSLMVMAPAGSMAMLETLIQAFDRLRPQMAEIRLFPLANADAEEVVQRLQDLFEAPSGAGSDVDQQLEFGGRMAGLVERAAAHNGELNGVRLPVRFSADRRTNTVIAAGHPMDLGMVEQLVQMLDIPDVEERITEVVMLQYSTAADVVSAVNDFVQEERDRLSDIEGETAAIRKAERHVTVVGDESSNSVLLGISPRYYSQIMSMIQQIDRPPPQVMIQVLIAEVTLDDSVELGFEWALQDLDFTQNAVIGPNGVIQGPGHDFVTGTDVGAGGAAGSFGGFSFTITGEDFNFLFRALQSNGMLQVLSRPTILVENNEEANITIGDRVPFVTSSSVSDSGQVNSQVQYEDVGIILNVTPHINPDGYVNLEVKPEISALNPSGSGVQISEGLTAPTFSQRSAETVVTVKDGETVVIGGLITNREDERETKVPLIGDVPGLGLLFRSTNYSTTRTELLIVLTVDVIRDEDDAEAMSVEQRDKGYLPDSIKQHRLMEGLRIVPGEEEGLGPAGEGEQGPTRRRKPLERPLYGPSPEIYGPQRQEPVQISSVPPGVYGPPLPDAGVQVCEPMLISHEEPLTTADSE